jgi:hypothetical protein
LGPIVFLESASGEMIAPTRDAESTRLRAQLDALHTMRAGDPEIESGTHRISGSLGPVGLVGECIRETVRVSGILNQSS